MPVTITIRNVPETARNELAARAAAAGKSMQEYLRDHLIEYSGRLTPAQWVQRLRDRPPLAPADPDAPSAVEIVRAMRDGSTPTEYLREGWTPPPGWTPDA